ncbi:hypothetical protein JCM3765_004275 [Sporobolomyces pararoseus]
MSQMPPRSSSSSRASLPRDIIQFLSNYPSNPSNPSSNTNLKFYQNQIPAKPSKKTIEELQTSLKGNFKELEFNHNFIQWLFPIREQGVNYQAKPLELHEITELKKDSKAMERLIESYRIMLEFYGFKLVSPLTGELTLDLSQDSNSSSSSIPSYLKRFENLENNSHNFLRITRILKCLNEFGFPQHPPAFLLYILTLQSPSPSNKPEQQREYLISRGLIKSMDNYWKYCIRDSKDREFVIETIDRVRNLGNKNNNKVEEEEFSWNVENYREWVKSRALERNSDNNSTEEEGEGEGEGEGKKRKNQDEEEEEEVSQKKKWCSIL